MRINKIFASAVFVGLMGIFGVLNVNEAGAASISNTIIQKAQANGILKCYNNNMFESPLKLDGFSKVKDFVEKGGDNYIALPTGATGIEDNGISCREVLEGYDGGGGKIEGLLKPGLSDTVDSKKEVLGQLGYTESASGKTGGQCFMIEAKEQKRSTNWLCVTKVDGDKITNATLFVSESEGGTKEVQWEVSKASSESSNLSIDCNTGYWPWNWTDGGCPNYTLKKGESWNSFVEKVSGEVGKEIKGGVTSDPVKRKTTDEITMSYEITDKSDAADMAVANLLPDLVTYPFGNNEKVIDYALTEEEKYQLYDYYLNVFYKANILCDPSGDEASIAAQKSGREQARLYDRETKQFNSNCWVKAEENKNKTVHGVFPDNYSAANKGRFSYDIGFSTLASELSKMTLTELSEETAEMVETLPTDNEGNEDEDSGSGTTKADPTCMNSGGVNSLGWIVCPVLEWLGETSEWLYNDFLEPSLNIKPELFDESQTGGQETKKAWERFQNIANILFVILFLIVIFSQLTGVGIDNYGIKRILPKLIITAILMNLSYYICLIAVDLSNILGNGLQAMFDNLGGSIQPYKVDGVSVLTSGTSTLISGALIAGLTAAGIWAVVTNPAILLSLLVGAIGVAISFLFLFILLSARQAAVVVLTVVSPLAFASYVLPNTKKSLFDKWLKIGQGLLLVYPIAGLLVGGGNFVSKLLLGVGGGSGNFAQALTAMLAGIVPIFFIPSVLKGAFAAMGNLGAKISSFGNGLRRGVDSGIRNSEGYKNMQKAGQDRRTRMKAGIGKDGKTPTRRGERLQRRANSKMGKAFGMDKRQAGYVSAALKNTEASEDAEALMIDTMSRKGIAEAGSAEKYYEKVLNDAVDSKDPAKMMAAFKALERAKGMKDKDKAKLVRGIEEGGKFGQWDETQRSAFHRDASGFGFLGKDLELSTFYGMSGKYQGQSKDAHGNVITTTHTELGALGSMMKNKGITTSDVKPSDLGKLSGDSLAATISGGVTDKDLAGRALVENPDLDVEKKVMLSAQANGADFSQMTAQEIKNAVSELLTLGQAGKPATMDLGGSLGQVTREMVSAWAAATPQSVNVVQNFNAGGRQINPVDVDLRGGGSNVPNGGSGSGGSSSGSAPVGGYSDDTSTRD